MRTLEVTESITWSQWFNRFLENEREMYRRADMEEDIDPRLHDAGPGADDYYPEELDESVIESLVIVTLAGALALLVYYRQQRQQAHRRLEDEQRRQRRLQQADGLPDGDVQQEPLIPGQQADGGFFPPPGDPNFDAWRIGGVGH